MLLRDRRNALAGHHAVPQESLPGWFFLGMGDGFRHAIFPAQKFYSQTFPAPLRAFSGTLVRCSFRAFLPGLNKKRGISEHSTPQTLTQQALRLSTNTRASDKHNDVRCTFFCEHEIARATSGSSFALKSASVVVSPSHRASTKSLAPRAGVVSR